MPDSSSPSEQPKETPHELVAELPALWRVYADHFKERGYGDGFSDATERCAADLEAALNAQPKPSDAIERLVGAARMVAGTYGERNAHPDRILVWRKDHDALVGALRAIEEARRE